MEVLRIEHLSKKYGHIKAIDDISFSLSSGRIYALVGNNGAGKTTLFRMVMGLSRPTSGSIMLFDSQTKKECEKARRKVGAIIENPILYENASGYRNLDYVRILKGIKRKGVIDEALQMFGLYDMKKVSVRHYSMGMKQRLSLACALLGDPDLLLLDEPLNGLDPSGIREIETTLLHKCNRDGTTVFISSHYLKQLYGFATDYILLDRGRITEIISAKDLDKKCNKCVYISVAEKDMEAAFRIVTQKVNNDVKILSGNDICIYGFQESTTIIKNALDKERIDVKSIKTTGINLEDYFIQTTGGVHNV